MAGASLLTLLDDIATVLDDVATLTDVASRQTAGVLGDDLALNAQQVAGVRAERELPVVWKVAKGSVRNKLILVPTALAVSAFAPWAVTPLLMLGGAYLCFEGVEKLAHSLLHSKADHAAADKERPETAAISEVDLIALETAKISGAIRTDFVLSAEIVTIALGSVASAPMGTRVAVLFSVAALMTVGVYGLVAAIVKLDDLGEYLIASAERNPRGHSRRRIGRLLLLAAPWLMKFLSVAGTAAMFLVGGGILTHGISPIHHGMQAAASLAGGVPIVGAALKATAPLLLNATFGIASGALLLAVVTGIKKLFVRTTV
jgi:predicted DNA repair protein MutK